MRPVIRSFGLGPRPSCLGLGTYGLGLVTFGLGFGLGLGTSGLGLGLQKLVSTTALVLVTLQ